MAELFSLPAILCTPRKTSRCQSLRSPRCRRAEERADKAGRFASTIAASFYYKDDEGEDYSISLTYTYMQDDTRWHYPADPERYAYRPVTVNGHEGMLGIYREENGSERCNSIIWMDEETNFQFQISFAWEELQFTEDELIAMAESVQMQEG